ncbi:hypothetical protein [Catalinimonas niigatensis]|uniref:hypothetical protein n=1 Tax=Catalinimonas niigatensis TaxID=1397264 RepID=UPI002666BFAA|nr:hypothetical protein [Catalinimonas niigatensis]WPP52793.1 hypothetical protein PZB72_10430 [Catalinimonas niigatensis]
MSKKSIEAQLAQASTLIMNASKHPKVKLQMSSFGYTAERMQQGYEFVNTFLLLQDEKDNCYSRNSGLRQQLDQDVKALKSLYKDHLTIARFAFRTDAYMQAQLHLKGKRKTDWAGWTAQVQHFYNRIEAEGMAAMKKHGAKAEELVQGKAMADALRATHQDKQSITADAQSATQRRDEVLKAMNRWVSDFKKVAQVALQDDPQLLEALGILVPSVR